MKTPLGMEVDLGPGHTVLDGIPALREMGTAGPRPLFDPCLLWYGRQSQLLVSPCLIFHDLSWIASPSTVDFGLICK